MQSVKLDDIVEKLDIFMDGWKFYYNKQTGKFLEIQEEHLRVAEELDKEDIGGYVDWEQEAIKDAIDVIENWDDYIELPDKYEINEYRIMERYCYSIDDEKISNELCYAISGRGAFRRFKDSIVRYNLEDKWYSFRYKALCKVARDWCEDNDIPFVKE